MGCCNICCEVVGNNPATDDLGGITFGVASPFSTDHASRLTRRGLANRTELLLELWKLIHRLRISISISGTCTSAGSVAQPSAFCLSLKFRLRSVFQFSRFSVSPLYELGLLQLHTYPFPQSSHFVHAVMLSKLHTNIVEPFLVLRQSLAPLRLSRWQLTKMIVKTMISDSPSRGAFVVAITSLLLFTSYRIIFGGKRLQMPQDLPVVKRNDSHFEKVVEEGRKKVRSQCPS